MKFQFAQACEGAPLRGMYCCVLEKTIVMVMLCHSSEYGCFLCNTGLCSGDCPCYFIFGCKGLHCCAKQECTVVGTHRVPMGRPLLLLLVPFWVQDSFVRVLQHPK